MLDDPSDQAVASRFFGGQPEVAPGVLLDPLEGLSGLLRELAVQPVAHLCHHARGDALGDLAADDHGARAKQPLGDEVVGRRDRRVEGSQFFHRLSGVCGHPWHRIVYFAARRRCRSSASARATYTRVICFRHDRSKSVLSIGFAGRYAASAAAAIASSDRSVPASAAPASGTSCGQLATPPSTIRASTTRSPLPAPCSHFVHAATRSTGKSNEPRRRSL